MVLYLTNHEMMGKCHLSAPWPGGDNVKACGKAGLSLTTVNWYSLQFQMLVILEIDMI